MSRFLNPYQDTAFNTGIGRKKKNPARDWTDRLFEKRDGAIQVQCRSCGTTMYVPPSKRNQRAHCSLECKGKTHQNNVQNPAPDWVGKIFVERPGAISKTCTSCEKTMWVPPSKKARKYCSDVCKAADEEKKREARKRYCETCGIGFYPRTYNLKKGDGRFCSQQCNTAARTALSSLAVQNKAARNRRQAFLGGLFQMPKGSDHPSWKGGYQASRKRIQESGNSTEYTRKWRAANPERVREQTRRRAGRKIGKLDYGTIPRIKKLQRGKCAICRVRLNDDWHMDHIVPLAKGGLHEARNIQLLCAPCNLKKSAKDPIEHMQSLGRLL